MTSRLGQRLLASLKVSPVDLAAASSLPVGPTSTDAAMRRAVDKVADATLGDLLDHYARLWPAAPGAAAALRCALLRDIADGALDAYYADLWARTNGLDDVVFVAANRWDDLLLSDPSNGRRVAGRIPRGARGAAGLIRRVARRGAPVAPPGPAPVAGPLGASEPADPMRATVMLVLNQGLTYGQLYAYDLLQGDDGLADLAPDNVLMMARTGGPGNAEGIRHAYPDAGGAPSRVRVAVTLYAGSWRRFRWRYPARFQWFFAAFAAQTLAQQARLADSFASLRLAVLAYEVQVPISLTLALEANGVRTAAINERITSILTESQPFAVGTLLTASDETAQAALASRTVAVGSAAPVGMWRSDLLVEYRRAPAHPEWQLARDRGQRCIVVLPYHAHPGAGWGGNPLATSVESVGHFLRHVAELAERRPDARIVVRGKSDAWVEDPRLADSVALLRTAANVSLSRDYRTLNESYRLCAQADLVLAKYTSLVDEALTVGIPSVVHDFTANASGIARPLARHLDPGVWAEDSDELWRRVEFALADGGEQFRTWWEPRRRRAFGDYSDGSVRSRARRELARLAVD
ncbi:MAG: hypothetical protein Q8M17_10770 [Actinomycetota bacterium]|nr:hypothetical protein [Actinomycetota bacterium]